MSTVLRRPPIGHAPGARAIALALAGLLAGSVQTTQAAKPMRRPMAAKPKAVLVAQPERVITEVMVVEGGRVAGQTTPENARKDGLTVVDLSDDWLPFVFSETPGEAAAAAAVSAGPGQRADAREQELRAPARGSFLRGVRDLPQPEPGAATAGGQASATPATTG